MSNIRVSLVTIPDYDDPIAGLYVYCEQKGLKNPVYKRIRSRTTVRKYIKQSGTCPKLFVIRLSLKGFKPIKRWGYSPYHAMYKCAQAFISENNLPVCLFY